MAAPHITTRSVVVVAPDRLSCDLAGEAAILNLTSGMYYGLNAVGARVWALIAEPRPVGDVLEQLLREFEVDARRCEQDLVALVEQLVAEGLVEVRNETR